MSDVNMVEKNMNNSAYSGSNDSSEHSQIGEKDGGMADQSFANSEKVQMQKKIKRL